MGYRITVSIGMAGRVQRDEVIGEDERPRLGFYWWFWLPYFSSNGGRFSAGECVDAGVKWGCFWFDFIFWPIKQKGFKFGHNTKLK